MITRSNLRIGETITYLPGHAKCKVVSLDHLCIEVQDEDGSLQSVHPTEFDLYEPVTPKVSSDEL